MSQTSPTPPTSTGGAIMGNHRRIRDALREAAIAALREAAAPVSNAQICQALPDLPVAGRDRCDPVVHQHIYRQLVGLEHARRHRPSARPDRWSGPARYATSPNPPPTQPITRQPPRSHQIPSAMEGRRP